MARCLSVGDIRPMFSCRDSSIILAVIVIVIVAIVVIVVVVYQLL